MSKSGQDAKLQLDALVDAGVQKRDFSLTSRPEPRQNTVNLLRERGVYLRSISDGVDPTTASGELMLNMLATLAEYERELIVERVNA